MEEAPQTFKELQPGTVLFADKYIIEKKIGEGGFGITYKAVQQGLNRTVCIKEFFLAGHCVRNTQSRTVQLQGISEETYKKHRLSFVKEAQTVASLHHPNIVEVIDIFDENNTSYMVMSFIEGCTLQDIVDTNGPLSYPDAVNYMAQITDAVGYIHQRKILHRDIKPENIMVTDDFKAILIDFGSAREFEHDKTQRHTSLLTHGYAPPEQYTANSRKGSYSDIYALGATLYFILTAKVPLEAAARLTEELIEPEQLNPSIPPEGNRTIMKAMRLKKEDRYQLVQDFMDDLRNITPKNTLGSQMAKVTKSIKLPKKNDRLMWGIVAGLVLLASIIVTKSVMHHRYVKQHEIEFARQDSLYVRSLNNFDFHLQRINNPEDLSNPAPVIEALEELKTIEEMESLDFFNESGKKPCYEEKLALYKQQLEKENRAIEPDLFYYEQNGRQNTTAYRKLLEKQTKNGEILSQLEKTGSAMRVELKP